MTSTADSVYIFGGDIRTDISDKIAKYKDDRWRQVGNLATKRRNHKAITTTFGTIIVGGIINYPSTYVNFNLCEPNYNLILKYANRVLELQLTQKRKHWSGFDKLRVWGDFSG